MYYDIKNKRVLKSAAWSFIIVLFLLGSSILIAHLPFIDRTTKSFFNWFVFIPLMFVSIFLSLKSILKIGVKIPEYLVSFLLSLPILIYFSYLLLALISKF
jgi:uncharacterized membrane protein YhdT